MRVKIGNELIVLNLLVLVLVLVIMFLPISALRIVLGIPFVLFFPGYVLVAALFPRTKAITGIERVALSFGLSVACVALIGLMLNYTPFGIRLESILYSNAAFIFVLSIVAYVRRRQLAGAEQFSATFRIGLSGFWKGSRLDKTLSMALVVAVLGTLTAVGYLIAKPRAGETFTEFYILRSEGAADYPSKLKLGEAGKVIVEIVNNEGKVVTYQVEVRIGGVKNTQSDLITLRPGEKWEESVSFVPQAVGQQQEVEFLLYKDGEPDPNLKPLHLRVDVTE